MIAKLVELARVATAIAKRLTAEQRVRLNNEERKELYEAINAVINA